MGDKHESCAGCKHFKEAGDGLGFCNRRPEWDDADKLRNASSWCTWYAATAKTTTIRVRIAVAVTADGDWCAVGSTRRAYCASPPGIRVEDWELAIDAHGIFDADSRVTWVEADVYMPAAVETVEGVTFEHGEGEDE